MSDRIRNVEVVSDGILVEFGDGVHCYFPATFLSDHVLAGSNQIFLDYDPSAKRTCKRADAGAGGRVSGPRGVSVDHVVAERLA